MVMSDGGAEKKCVVELEQVDELTISALSTFRCLFDISFVFSEYLRISCPSPTHYSFHTAPLLSSLPTIHF
jgi:hypothetical protein